ncbi:uncharacterized protein TRIADDRAFT_28764, partial [Trichoplax adhaerens]
FCIPYFRIAKYWWNKLPTHKKHNYKRMLKRHQQVVYIIALFGTGAGIYYIYNHIESVPLTGRTRLMMLSHEHLQELGKMLYDEQIQANGEHLLPTTSSQYHRVKSVVSRLIKNNGDIPQINTLHWEINIIDSNEVNAFVLPDGQIFVYKGMLSTLGNDDALAFLLGHEMAHALLSHAAEQLSFFNIFDLLAAVSLGLVWALMPTDVVAAVTHWFHNSIASICLHRPYSRKLEVEADLIGSNLATKACYDVRAATYFWEMLANKDPSNAELEWLSTHPSHQKRADLIKERMTEVEYYTHLLEYKVQKQRIYK